METGGETRVTLPPDLLTKVVQEGLTAAEALISSKIEGQALRAGLTHADIAPQLEQTKLGDRRRAIVAELVPLALAEHGLDPEMSPTTALGLVLVPWGFGAYTAYAELGKLAAEKAARDERERSRHAKPGA